MANHPRTRIVGSGTATPTGTHGSQTVLQSNAGPSAHDPSVRLILRAEPEERPHVQWAEDVVDNENMGKKSSKVCCIYHKPREPGDSESESDSSSSDGDGDSEPDLSRARKAGGKKRRGHRHDHPPQDDAEKPRDADEGGAKGKGKRNARRPSPNAYERQSKHKGKTDP